MHAPTKSFFDITTNTASYVVRDPSGTSCAIIDSVLDFDYASGQTDTKAADQIIAWVKSEGLDVKWILETHAHADHLSAAPYLQERLGGKIGISEQIKVVQDRERSMRESDDMTRNCQTKMSRISTFTQAYFSMQ